jgi:tryptophan synthase alpha chain
VTYAAATQYSNGAIIGSAFIKFLEDKGVERINEFVLSIRN